MFLNILSKLTLRFSVDLNGGETKLSAENFLKADMKNKVMKNIILNTLSNSYVYETYKVNSRHMTTL